MPECILLILFNIVHSLDMKLELLSWQHATVQYQLIYKVENIQLFSRFTKFSYVITGVQTLPEFSYLDQIVKLDYNYLDGLYILFY